MPRKKNFYFTKEVDKYILQYNNDKNLTQEERNKLFEEKIYPAVSKLVEYVINRFKFYEIKNSTYEEVYADVMLHLIDYAIPKFDPDRGSAYSFLSVSVKWFLSQKSKKENKKNYTDMAVDSLSDFENTQLTDIVNFNEFDYDKNRGEETIINFEFLQGMVTKFEEFSLSNLSDKTEIEIVYAIIQLLENSDRIDFYNKRYIYSLIKEIVGLESPNKITSTIQKLKMEYKEFTNGWRNE